MEIKKKYFEKYLHDIAIEQIAEDYLQKGYKVFKEELIGKYRADLMVKKGGETIIIEVKSGKMTKDKKDAIAHLGNYVRSHGNYKFLVAIATPPKEKKLDIADIKSLLTQNLIEKLTQKLMEELPDELDQLSTHSRIEDITDVDIDEIKIEGKSIFVKGDGVISVELQYGSDGDQDSGDGYKTNDSFPFDFEITLEYSVKNKLEIKKVNKLEVDTSSFYE